MSNYDKQNVYQKQVQAAKPEQKPIEKAVEVKAEEVKPVQVEAKPVENNKVQVRALDTYQKNLITDKELGRIPQKGEIFTVSKERFEILSGKNEHKIVFVEKI